jgi:hypothetical protein
MSPQVKLSDLHCRTKGEFRKLCASMAEIRREASGVSLVSSPCSFVIRYGVRGNL